MAAKKDKTQFMCSQCGDTFIKWMGKCSSCGAFGTVKEFRQSGGKKNGNVFSSQNSSPDTVELPNYATIEPKRTETGFQQVDAVFGGGIVTGSISLIAGSPGIGKSTLLLQIASKAADCGKKVFYVSGEESIEQIAIRAKRIFADKSPIKIATETCVEQLIEILEREKPDLAIIDSIQTIFSDETEGISGSVSQVRSCAAILTNFAKKYSTAIVIIGHITKEGSIAGPRLLEHIVDVILTFEGEDFNRFRILRGQKNRFGASGEIAVFDMSAQGLSEIRDTAKIFLNELSRKRPGCATVPLIEGSRVIMVEIQALVNKSHFGNSQRVANGINPKRIALISAVLEKYTGISLGDYDIFVNVTGGLNVSEPAVDLAVAAAIVSSYTNKVIPVEYSFMGELGLGGEIRPVVDMEKRIKEVIAMGFEKVICPAVPKISKEIQLAMIVCRDICRLGEILR
ncbi:MAG: DNA repair protein RadA [Chitinispirillales bacterium]|jgi:DNA repair protein RadA/Sms|nr:DNA repair protein RadA [Chitinispirillales bacterium]